MRAPASPEAIAERQAHSRRTFERDGMRRETYVASAEKAAEMKAEYARMDREYLERYSFWARVRIALCGALIKAIIKDLVGSAECRGLIGKPQAGELVSIADRRLS